MALVYTKKSRTSYEVTFNDRTYSVDNGYWGWQAFEVIVENDDPVVIREDYVDTFSTFRAALHIIMNR